MMYRTMIRSLLLGTTLLVVAAAVPQAVASQSALATRGLGFPVEPSDARAKGLGGVALGFREPEISWVNPAAVVGLPAAGMTATYQYDSFDTEFGVQGAAGATARFPLAMGAFPMGERVVLTAGFGSFLDQNWALEHADTLLLEGDTVAVLDRIASSGGVVRLRAGAAYQLRENLGIGFGLDAYTGQVDRTQGRIFPGQAEPDTAVWTYRGLGATAGVHWNPSEAVGFGASASFGGTLEASPRRDLFEAASYSLPVTLRAGASGLVGQNTVLALGGVWTGWSTMDAALAAEGGARDSWSIQGGIEWEGMSLRERPLPLRLGARTAALPFRWDPGPDDDWASEQALTLGAGLDLAGGATRPDIAVEWGRRGGDSAGFDESYWRFVLSVRVVGR
jgi:hypothetical protein